MKISPEWVEHRDIRKEYREELDSYTAGDLEIAKIGENSAVSLAQMVIKSAFILNGGGIIAIPAIVTLFNLDAERAFPRLFLTAFLFVGGLLCASLASILAFFALAHKADTFYNNANHTAALIQSKYFPLQTKALAEQADASRKRAARMRVRWIRERYLGIILSIAAVVLFTCGALFGGYSILRAPHKAIQENTVSLTSPPCKNGSQTCQPWERDWKSSEPKPGPSVNAKGPIIQPPAAKP